MIQILATMYAARIYYVSVWIQKTKGDNHHGRSLYEFLQVKNLKVKKIV